MSLQDKYAIYIINRMLRLQEGEHLYINSTEESLPFAHIVAHAAADLSGVPASIVYIENGRVQSVDEIESESGIKREEKGVAMLHLSTFQPSRFSLDEEDDAIHLQQHRLLSDPLVLDRRISTPWAVAWIPTLKWAEFVYGQGSTVDELFMDLADYLGLEDENDTSSTIERTLSMRCEKLNSMKIESLHLSGPSVELEAFLAKGARIGTSAFRLPDGRFFYPSLPCEDIIIPVDFRKAEGWIKATYPFRLYDRTFESVELEIRGGKIASFEIEDSAYAGKYLNIDGKAASISEIILCESLTRSARFSRSFGVPLLDRMRSSEIVFGGITPELVSLQDEALLESHGLNNSFARLEVPFGSRELTVTARTSEQDVVIFKDGIFVLDV